MYKKWISTYGRRKGHSFARHRHTLPAGDFQRVQHQQLVVEAIANSAKTLKNVDAFFKST